MKVRNSVWPASCGLPVALVTSFFAAQAVAQDVESGVPDVLIQRPDTIYTNGHIVTFDNTEISNDPGSVVEALAVRDSKIMALGPEDEIMELEGDDTEVIDLQGKTMLPGFVHAHNHIFGPAEEKSFDIFGLSQVTPGYYLNTSVEFTSEEIKAKIEAAVDQLREVESVEERQFIGVQIFPDPDKGFPSIATVSNLMGTADPSDQEITQADLDEMVPDRMFELTSAATVQDRSEDVERDVWYELSAGPDGAPAWEEVVEFDWEPWEYNEAGEPIRTPASGGDN